MGPKIKKVDVSLPYTLILPFQLHILKTPHFNFQHFPPQFFVYNPFSKTISQTSSIRNRHVHKLTPSCLRRKPSKINSRRSTFTLRRSQIPQHHNSTKQSFPSFSQIQ